MKQVLLWSKYSPNCKRLLDLMVQYGANIEKICIDNSDIRQRIIGDNRLKITVVPTLLSIYPTGVIEKYEGEKVIELLNASFGPSVEPAIKQRPAEPNPEKKETVKTSSSSTALKKQKSSGVSALEDLEGEEIFDVEQEKIDKNSMSQKDLKENLPVKPSSNISARAAAIAQSRDNFDAGVKRPTQNNITPDK